MAALPPDDEIPLVPLAEPNAGLAKTVGILNIVFGAILMLCGVCAGANIGAQTAFGPMMAAQREQALRALRAEHEAQLKKLQDDLDAAEDAEQKAALQAELKAAKARPAPVLPDTTKWAAAPQVRGYAAADALSGLLLNLLMLLSGVGLVALKEWARRLALWVAGLKIVRLVALYGYFALVVAPIIAQQFRVMFEEVNQAQPAAQGRMGPNEMAQFTTMMGAMMTGSAVAMIVLGAIYPAVVLVLLTRPRVKAACAGQPPQYGFGPPA